MPGSHRVVTWCLVTSFVSRPNAEQTVRGYFKINSVKGCINRYTPETPDAIPYFCQLRIREIIPIIPN